jgi:pyochelin synthetase
VKVRGHRVELGEVEAALGAHSAVATAVVVASGRGSEHVRLAAFVEPAHVNAPTPPPIREAAVAAGNAILDRVDVAAYIEYTCALDNAALAAILRALHENGLFTTASAHTVNDVMVAVGANPRYLRVTRRWLRALVSAGLLREDGGAYYRTELEPPALPALTSALDGCAFDGPRLREYFAASRDLLLPLVRGDQSALALLYPEGQPQVATSLYEDALLNRWGNAVAAAMVGAICDGATRARVLEIGVGVGGTMGAVLAALKSPFEYRATDVSPYFTAMVHQRFGPTPSIQIGRFDIDHDYREQGLFPNGFDVIVSGDVLHVARHVPSTLTRLRELLAPGGWLIAVEMTQDHAQIMTSLELLNASDAPVFEDARSASHATFFSRADWIALFRDAGADVVVDVPDHGEFARTGLCAFAARFKAERACVDPQALEAFLRDRVPSYMVPAHLEVVDTLPLTANGKVDRARLLAWAAPVAQAPPATVGIDDELQQRLVALWEAVLARPLAGVDVDFFRAGGDSLLAAQLAGRILEEIPEARAIFFDDLLRRVLEGPTVAELATVIRDGLTVISEASSEVAQPASAQSSAGDDRPLCVVVGARAISSDTRMLLGLRYRVVEVTEDAHDMVTAELTGRCGSIAAEARGRTVYVVGLGRASHLAAEIARVLLDYETFEVRLTIAPTLDGATAKAPPTYGGNLHLLRASGEESIEHAWRAACLGELQITEIETDQWETVISRATAE